MTLLFLHARTYLCTFIYDLAIWKSDNLFWARTNCLLFPPSPQWIFQGWPSVRRDLRTPCLWFIRGYNTMTGTDADKGDVTWKTVSVWRKAKRSSEKTVKSSSMLCILNRKHRGGRFGRGKGLVFCSLEMVIVFDWLCIQNIKRQNIWYTAIDQHKWIEVVSPSEMPSY